MIMITKWCKHRGYIKTSREGHVLMQEMVADPAEDERTTSRPNAAMFGDVVEVLAVDYPLAVVDVHSVAHAGFDYNRARVWLDLTEFECRLADPQYIAAVMSGRPAPTPAEPPASARSGSARIVMAIIIGFAVLGTGVFISSLASLIFGGGR